MSIKRTWHKLMKQKVIKLQLKKIGYQCEIANNGQEALDKLAEDSYSLILMDCQMPVLNGYDATKAIRDNQDTKDTIIIGLSAFAMKEDIQKSLNIGMNDYLAKPCKLDKLEKVLQKWINKDN